MEIKHQSPVEARLAGRLVVVAADPKDTVTMDDNPSLAADFGVPPIPDLTRRRCSFCSLEDRGHLIGGDPPPLAVCLDGVVLLVEIFKTEGSWPE